MAEYYAIEIMQSYVNLAFAVIAVTIAILAINVPNEETRKKKVLCNIVSLDDCFGAFLLIILFMAVGLAIYFAALPSFRHKCVSVAVEATTQQNPVCGLMLEKTSSNEIVNAFHQIIIICSIFWAFVLALYLNVVKRL